MTEYYDKQLWAQHDAAVRTAKVEGDKVIESFVWQPGGNIMGYDGPDPDNCQTVEDLERNGYKKRR